MSRLTKDELSFIDRGLDSWILERIQDRLARNKARQLDEQRDIDMQSAMNQVDGVLVTNWVSVDNNDYRKALNDLITFNVQIALDPAVNGGSVTLNPTEIKALNRLLAGYVTGPGEQKVLDKLREAE